MARQSGVNIEKLQGGLGRLATGTDNHVALVIVGLGAGSVLTAIMNEGKGVVLTSVFDAEQLGINASFDANNDIRIYADVVEFFRLAPEGTLYLFGSTEKEELKGFINQNKEIKGYAFGFDYIPAAGEDPANLVPTINEQQIIINEFAAENRLIDFVVVAPNGMETFTENLRLLNAPNVSVAIGCSDDEGVVNLGAFLGMIAVRKINENVGSVNIQRKPLAKRGTVDYSLTDQTLGVWLDAFLTDGRSVEEITKSELNALINNGYILAAGYEGYPGYFFTNSSTCVASESDYAYIENNRTWNKAARIIRTTLLPEVRGVVKKDPTTGFIQTTTASRWQQLCAKSLDRMIADDEISGYDVFVNPEQIVNSTQPVVVKASVVADGIVHEFEVALGLTNNI